MVQEGIVMTANWIDRLKQDEEGRRLLEQERLIVEVTEAMASAMKQRGVSHSELARRIDTSTVDVIWMLSGQHHFTLRTLSDVFFALGYSVHFSLADNSNRPRGNTLTGATNI